MRSHIAISLGFLLRAVAAQASPATPADALIEKGISLRREGQNEEALNLFQKAHAFSPTGRTLAQMGLAEASLERWIAADIHLVAALDAHDAPWIENAETRDVLEKTLTVIRTHIGLVNVVGPAGAEIAVAGKPAGHLPLATPLRLAEGRVRVHGSAKGRRSASVDLPVRGGQEMTVHFNLPLISLQQPAPPTSAPLLHASLDDHPVAEASSWKKWTGGGLLGVSAGLVASGVVWMAIDGNGTCSPPSGGRCERVYDTKTPGLMAIGVGAAAAVGGGLLLWQGRHSETHVGIGFGSLSAAGTF